MPTTLAIRPAVGLMPPGFDPRPCVNRPAQWWDLGNEHNPRAVRYCRNVCLLRIQCKAAIKDATLPKGQIRAGNAYNEYGKRLTICGDCDTPRTRVGTYGTPTCGCTPPHLKVALAASNNTASAEAAKRWQTADWQAARRPHTVMVELWLPLHQQGKSVKEAAEVLGLSPNTLKAALRAARNAGDTRVPMLRAANNTRRVAA